MRAAGFIGLLKMTARVFAPTTASSASAVIRQSGGNSVTDLTTPPARSTEAPAAVEVADLVLIPTTPDVEPLEQMPRTLRLCRGFSRRVFAVVNMANPTGPAEVAYTREVIEAMGAKTAPVVLHRRKAHRDASASGLTVQEVDPNGKAAAEVASLWAWVRAELQGSK